MERNNNNMALLQLKQRRQLKKDINQSTVVLDNLYSLQYVSVCNTNSTNIEYVHNSHISNPYTVHILI